MTTEFDAVLFDCDGVLADSESITNGVLRDMLEELGWKLTNQESMRLFLGKAVKAERALVEAHTGQPLTEDRLVRFRERRNGGPRPRPQAGSRRDGSGGPVAAGAAAIFRDMADLPGLLSDR